MVYKSKPHSSWEELLCELQKNLLQKNTKGLGQKKLGLKTKTIITMHLHDRHMCQKIISWTKKCPRLPCIWENFAVDVFKTEMKRIKISIRIKRITVCYLSHIKAYKKAYCSNVTLIQEVS